MAPVLAQLFLLLFGFFTLPFLGTAAANDFPLPNSSSTPIVSEQRLADSLNQYLQWGLFDSLYLASSTAMDRLVASQNSLDSTEKARRFGLLYHFRALAAFGQHDSVRAEKDFEAAACWKSGMRLDSFYIPQPMIRFNDSVFRRVESQPSLCATYLGLPKDALVASPIPMVVNVSPPPTLEPPAPTSPTSESSVPMPVSNGYTKAGWGLAGLAATAFGVTLWEQAAMSEAHDRQSEAGLAADTDRYEREGQSVQRHFQRRNVAFLSSMVLASASGWCFYKAQHGRARVSPNAISMHWSF